MTVFLQQEFGAHRTRLLSAVLHAPIALAMIAELQQSVLGIVALAAVGADQEVTPLRSVTIVLLGNGEAGTAAAWHQEHLEVFARCVCRILASLGLGHYFVSSTITGPALFFLLLD